MNRLLTILVLLLTFAGTAQAEDRMVVTLHTTIFSSSRIIRLSEVAHIDSKDAALAKKAGATTLGRVRSTKMARTISADRISERLRWFGIPKEDFMVVGTRVSVFNAEKVEGTPVYAKVAKKDEAASKTVAAKATGETKSNTTKAIATKADTAGTKSKAQNNLVESFEEKDSTVLPKAAAGTIVSVDDLLTEVREFIIKDVANKAEGIKLGKIVLVNERRNGKLSLLKDGDIEFINATLTNGKSMTPFGRREYNLEIRKGETIEKGYTFSVTARHMLRVAFAKRTLASRTMITEDDIEFKEEAFETRTVGDFATELAHFLYMAPNSSIPAGHKILRTKLKPALVVKRGDRVQVLPQSNNKGMVKLFGKTFGTAQRSGAIGDEIFVKILIGKDQKTKQDRFTETLVRITGVGTAETVKKVGE